MDGGGWTSIECHTTLLLDTACTCAHTFFRSAAKAQGPRLQRSDLSWISRWNLRSSDVDTRPTTCGGTG